MYPTRRWKTKRKTQLLDKRNNYHWKYSTAPRRRCFNSLIIYYIKGRTKTEGGAKTNHQQTNRSKTWWLETSRKGQRAGFLSLEFGTLLYYTVHKSRAPWLIDFSLSFEKKKNKKPYSAVYKFGSPKSQNPSGSVFGYVTIDSRSLIR